MKRVFITGYGIVTSIGIGVEENFRSLLSRTCGFGKIKILETMHRQDLPACEINYTDERLCSLAEVPTGKGYTRTALLGLIAAKEAIHTAGLSVKQRKTTGFLSATTTGGIREMERCYHELQDAMQQGDFVAFADTANPGEHTERISTALGIGGYIGTVSTACSSSANTIMNGAQLIRNGELDQVICGGAEALSKFTLNGFNTLMILDADQCRPFDATRKGLNLGEGAAYVVLESEESVVSNKKKPIAELIGYGNTNDAYHQTASSPDGAGAYDAMKTALRVGNVSPSAVSYINAHGTATENNDLSEGLAIQNLFGNAVPFSSTKPYTGHTLAAAGGIEAVFCMMAVQHKIIFPSINYSSQMPELTIAPEKDFIKDVALKYVLSNSFGFGGNASSLLFASV